ncbi:hypothetical protein D3C77_572030 [compost metagenome]
MALEISGGFFTHQIDGGAQGPGTGQQSCGAFKYLDTVIDGHVAQGIARRIGDVAYGGGNAVVLEVVDGKTTGVIVGTVAVEGRDGDAGCMAHHVINVVEAEVIHVLASDDGDRLRGLPGCQDQARCRGDSAWGIGARTFGNRA